MKRTNDILYINQRYITRKIRNTSTVEYNSENWNPNTHITIQNKNIIKKKNNNTILQKEIQ